MFNITKEELAAGVKEADDNSGVFHFKNAVAENPSWDEFFEHLDYETNNQGPIKAVTGEPKSERVINGLILKNLFYMAAVLNKEDFFKNLKEFREFVSSALGAEANPVTSFVSLISGDTSDPHHDCRKTLFWQCQGTTTFDHLVSSDRDKVGRPDNVKGSYVLSAGDLIYLGWEVPHNVFVTGPRAAITFDVWENSLEAHPYPGQEYNRGNQ
jgi:hypothetical protein